jgi:hypothetical protein
LAVVQRGMKMHNTRASHRTLGSPPPTAMQNDILMEAMTLETFSGNRTTGYRTTSVERQ